MYGERFSFFVRHSFVTYTQRCRLLRAKQIKQTFCLYPKSVNMCVSMYMYVCMCVSASIYARMPERDTACSFLGPWYWTFFIVKVFCQRFKVVFFSPRQGGTSLAGGRLIACLCVGVYVCVCRLLVLSFLFLGNRRNRKLSDQPEAPPAFALYTDTARCLYLCVCVSIYTDVCTI